MREKNLIWEKFHMTSAGEILDSRKKFRLSEFKLAREKEKREREREKKRLTSLSYNGITSVSGQSIFRQNVG